VITEHLLTVEEAARLKEGSNLIDTNNKDKINIEGPMMLVSYYTQPEQCMMSNGHLPQSIEEKKNKNCLTYMKLKTNESYVIASQPQQVYYIKDTKDPNWLIVVKTKPRDWYDMPKENINKACQENKDIGSISFTFNESDNEHGFSMDRNDLA